MWANAPPSTSVNLGDPTEPLYLRFSPDSICSLMDSLSLGHNNVNVSFSLGHAVNSIVFRISVIYPDVRQKEITWQENTDDTTYPTDSGR